MSLCRSLAQKLAMRLNHRYTHGELIEINSHSLFSKWFLEICNLQSWLNAHATCWRKQHPFCVISVLCGDVHKIWDFTQRRVVIPYRRFGPTYRTHHQGSASSGNSMPTCRNLSVEMGLTGCPETSVRIYHATSREIPDERISSTLLILSVLWIFA
jgi:hypothetical protein